MSIELVNSPSHYQTSVGYEAADVLDAYGLGPHLWNAGKYLLRAGKKGGADKETDLRKADWYVKRAIRNAPLCCAGGQRDGRGLTIHRVVADFSLDGPVADAVTALLGFGAAPEPAYLLDCELAIAAAILEARDGQD